MSKVRNSLCHTFALSGSSTFDLIFWQSMVSTKLFSNSTLQMNQFSFLAFFTVQLLHPYIVISNTIQITFTLFPSDNPSPKGISRALEWAPRWRPSLAMLSFKSGPHPSFTCRSNVISLASVQHKFSLDANLPVKSINRRLIKGHLSFVFLFDSKISASFLTVMVS